jgi:FMN phosphatase YigB (HAD superfamily)
MDTPPSSHRPVRAVLFDLDGTLLDIDIGSFMSRYMRALASFTENLYPGEGVMDAVMAGTRGMMGTHPGETNESVFHRVAKEHTGADLTRHRLGFDEFYQGSFDALREDAGPAHGAHEVMSLSFSLGLRVAIATNPMFPPVAIEKRMAWAELLDYPVDLVTTWESMHACKPHGEYFTQVAQMLEVEPGSCLMVGDDADLDLPAASVGMRTFYVGDGAVQAPDLAGSLADLIQMLPGLVS